MSELTRRLEHYRVNYSIPYIPTISTGFDSSPRTLVSDGWPTSMAEMHTFGRRYHYSTMPCIRRPLFRLMLSQSIACPFSHPLAGTTEGLVTVC